MGLSLARRHPEAGPVVNGASPAPGALSGAGGQRALVRRQVDNPEAPLESRSEGEKEADPVSWRDRR